MTGDTLAIGIPTDLDTARAVLARGRTLATKLGLGWVAVLIRNRQAPAEAIRRLEELVVATGGEVRCEESDDVADGLLEVSRREGVRLLVIGASHRPWLLRRFVRGTTERLLRAPRSFDVVVARNSPRQGAMH